MKLNKKVALMTTEEKIALVEGHKSWNTNAIKRVDIKNIFLTDGPHGLRKATESSQITGLSNSVPATSFPTAAAVACSFDEQLAFLMGAAIGRECRHNDVNVLLGPGVNIKRNPLCGRNFEYYSEDPLLSGKMGSAFVKGVQSTGVSACPKHFALNNQENNRFVSNSVVDKRAFFDIYLKPFEIIVREAKPDTIMCSYNKINGVTVSENKHLLTDILVKKWEYQGLVMSDWGATINRAKGINAGMHLDMPGDVNFNRHVIAEGLKNGKCSEEALNIATSKVIDLTEKHTNLKPVKLDIDENIKLATKIARESAVLLKNKQSLPLSLKKKHLVVGDLFQTMRYQGSGSSLINPHTIITPKTAFDDAGVNYEFVRGYDEAELNVNDIYLDEVKKKVASYDEVLLFIGLTDYLEMEAIDREHMKLPQNQIALIDLLVRSGKKINICLFGGAPIELPFIDDISAVLMMYLPGCAGGRATFEILFGQHNPSGRLAETWPIAYEDVPFGNEFSTRINEIYRESIFVGYRYYNTANKAVRFPFGYGLSYTKFKYSNLVLTEKDNELTITWKVKNIGKVPGHEVSQIYFSKPESKTNRPKRELLTFTKIFLEVNEEKTVTAVIPKNALKYFDLALDDFYLESGEYIFEVGGDSLNVILSTSLFINSSKNIKQFYLSEYAELDNFQISDEVFERLLKEKIPEEPKIKPFTLETQFKFYQESFMGNIILRALTMNARRTYKKTLKMPSSIEREMLRKDALFIINLMHNSCARSLMMASGGMLTHRMAQGFVHFANGKIFKGLGHFIKKEQAFLLPLDSQKNG